MTNQVNRYPSSSKKGISLGKKCWWTCLVKKISCNQWECWKCIHEWSNYFLFEKAKGRRIFCFFFVLNFVFLSCSQNVFKYIPQDVPNSTLVLSYIICPKFNSHVYKLKRWAMGEYFCFYFAIGVPKSTPIKGNHASMFQKNWWWANE